jgi:hypothetical protein
MIQFQPGLLHMMKLDEQWKKVDHGLWVNGLENVPSGQQSSF